MTVAPPSWFGEAVLLIGYLGKHGVLSKISEQVRFARRRFGRYEVIDFLAVLFGYAISGEGTLEAFYERLQPFVIFKSRRVVDKFDRFGRPDVWGRREGHRGVLLDCLYQNHPGDPPQ